MPASQLLGTAIANLKKATAIRMTGTVLASGTRTSFRVTIVPDTGCESIIAIAGKSTARIAGLGSAVSTEHRRQLWAASGVPQMTTLAVPLGTLTNHGSTILEARG